VFSLRNLADMDRIIAFMQQNTGGRVAVIGAGFIGIEMAEQLQRIGADTVLVELQDQVLPPLDYEMAKPIQIALEKEGVSVKVGSGIQGLQSEDGQVVTCVQLDNGEELKVDAVILGIGVRPNTALAEAAGLEIGKTGGIAVNEFMQTSNPDVYAVGDAVEYRHGVLGIDMRVALAGPANRAGRTAGEHAATNAAHPAKPVLGTAVLRAFGCSAAMTGVSSKQATMNKFDARSVTIIANNHAGYFPGAAPMRLKLVYEAGTGRILGAQAVGADGVDKRIDVIATAISLGGTVEDLTGLDLCYAPPFGSAKDPVHMAAFAALNDLDGITPMVPSDANIGDAQVIDVRTDKEVKALPMEGAIHIPVDVLRSNLDQLDPAKSTIVVCQSGLRAHIATRILKQSGFTDVSDLTGGMAVRSMTK
jgi:NADPH-dependent 2,4-dienoyl-CoA reductase/sulfur reductase-like enzyme/rhodanese-related sulfurtransferase